jgi:hypothetical protein
MCATFGGAPGHVRTGLWRHRLPSTTLRAAQRVNRVSAMVTHRTRTHAGGRLLVCASLTWAASKRIPTWRAESPALSGGDGILRA